MSKKKESRKDKKNNKQNNKENDRENNKENKKKRKVMEGHNKKNKEIDEKLEGLDKDGGKNNSEAARVMQGSVKEEKTPAKLSSDKALLYVIILILLIIGSFFAGKIFFGEKDEDYERITYNNFEFTNIGGLWYFQWQKENTLFTVPLRFNPYDVEDVTIIGELNSSFNRREVYVMFDPEQEDLTYVALGAAELSQNIAKAINAVPIAACPSNETEACIGRPIVKCGEPGKSVIYLSQQEPTGIILNGECIIVQGNDLELLKSVDRLLYQWYGIMK